MNEQEVKAELEAWVLNNTRIKEIQNIPYEFDLITNRVIDSLRFVDFVLFIEELSGRTITLESISLQEFQTINAIWQHFFK